MDSLKLLVSKCDFNSQLDDGSVATAKYYKLWLGNITITQTSFSLQISVRFIVKHIINIYK